jgi:hypothetical protein
MDDKRFDELSRRLAVPLTRGGFFKTLSALGGSALAAITGLDLAEAKKGNDGNKGNGGNQGKGGGKKGKKKGKKKGHGKKDQNQGQQAGQDTRLSANANPNIAPRCTLVPAGTAQPGELPPGCGCAANADCASDRCCGGNCCVTGAACETDGNNQVCSGCATDPGEKLAEGCPCDGNGNCESGVCCPHNQASPGICCSTGGTCDPTSETCVASTCNPACTETCTVCDEQDDECVFVGNGETGLNCPAPDECCNEGGSIDCCTGAEVCTTGIGCCIPDGQPAPNAEACCGNDFCPNPNGVGGICAECPPVQCNIDCDTQGDCTGLGIQGCVCLGIGVDQQPTCGQCIVNGQPANNADECCTGNFCEEVGICGPCPTCNPACTETCTVCDEQDDECVFVGDGQPGLNCLDGQCCNEAPGGVIECCTGVEVCTTGIGCCVPDGQPANNASECCGNDFCPNPNGVGGICAECPPVECAGNCENQGTCNALGNDCVCLGIGVVEQPICGACIPDNQPANSAGECCGNDFCPNANGVGGICAACPPAPTPTPTPEAPGRRRKKGRCPKRYNGLAQSPCNGKCRCVGGRRCQKGRCCEKVGTHCDSDAECCSGTCLWVHDNHRQCA